MVEPIYWENTDLTTLPEKSKGAAPFGLAIYKRLFPDPDEQQNTIIEPAKPSNRRALRITEDERAKILYGSLSSFF